MRSRLPSSCTRWLAKQTFNHPAQQIVFQDQLEVINAATGEQTLRGRLKDLPLNIRSIAWKAQVRLCSHYRRLIANGKKTPVATAAIAREVAAFLWAIGQRVAPQTLAT